MGGLFVTASEAGGDIMVAAEVLRRTVEHDVDSELVGPQIDRGGERGVEEHGGGAFVRGRRERLDVENPEERVHR